MVVLASIRIGDDGGLRYDVHLFGVDGTELRRAPFPSDVVPLKVSPDLSYVLSFSRLGDGGHYEIATLDNDLVAKLPGGPANGTLFPIGFATAGVVNVCRVPVADAPSLSGTALRWEYFTPMRPYGGASLPCLVDVG